MEENLINSQPVQPAPSIQQAQPVSPAEEKTEIPPKITGKTKDFLIGLFFGLAGAIVLAFLDLLFIAMANPAQEILIALVVFLGPLLILGLYIFFLVYFFKRQKFIFWGLLSSFFIFIVLAILATRIV